MREGTQHAARTETAVMEPSLGRRPKHRAHRRMMNDRVGDMLGVLGARQRAHRATLLAVPERVLERKFGRSHALWGKGRAPW